jgi:hypothetical protein
LGLELRGSEITSAKHLYRLDRNKKTICMLADIETRRIRIPAVTLRVILPRMGSDPQSVAGEQCGSGGDRTCWEL